MHNITDIKRTRERKKNSLLQHKSIVYRTQSYSIRLRSLWYKYNKYGTQWFLVQVQWPTTLLPTIQLNEIVPSTCPPEETLLSMRLCGDFRVPLINLIALLTTLEYCQTHQKFVTITCIPHDRRTGFALKKERAIFLFFLQYLQGTRGSLLI